MIDSEKKRSVLSAVLYHDGFFRTMMNQNMRENLLMSEMGGWILHNSKGELTTEAIENEILFLSV